MRSDEMGRGGADRYAGLNVRYIEDLLDYHQFVAFKKGIAVVAVAVVLLLAIVALAPRILTTTTSVVNVPITYTLLHENAEESNFSIWDARWARIDANPADSDDHWCRTMHDSHDGNHSIYCARIGYNSHYQTPIRMSDGSTGYTQPWNVNVTGLPATTPQSQWVMRYDTNQDAIMRKAVIDAQYYGNVTMTFWFWSHTGTSDAVQPDTNTSVGYDFLNALYFTGNGDNVEKHVLWTDSYQQATAQKWTEVTLSVPTDATMVGFEFVSGTTAPQGGDSSSAFASSGVRVTNGGMLEGVYLDGIYVNGSEPSAGLPLATTVEDMPSSQNSTEFPVSVAANNQSNLEYVNLFYRKDGSSSWTKYTTSSNHDGKFTSSPIDFIAPSNGTYEFLSQGMDRSGASETLRNKADAWTVVEPTSNVSGTALSLNDYAGQVPPPLVSIYPDAGIGLAECYDGAYRMMAAPLKWSL